jgi:hypothetical protein
MYRVCYYSVLEYYPVATICSWFDRGKTTTELYSYLLSDMSVLEFSDTEIAYGI